MKTILLSILIATGMAFACGAAEKRIAGVYKTQRGDTLDSIAKRFRMKPEQVSALNPKLQFDRLQIGQPIRVHLRNADRTLMYPTIPPQVID